jgi:hypothetical protein
MSKNLFWLIIKKYGITPKDKNAKKKITHFTNNAKL